MYSIKHLVKANARRLLLINIIAFSLLIIFYARTGLARGLGKRAVIYQLLLPNSFYSVIAFINVLYITVVRPIPRIFEQIRQQRKEDWVKTVLYWIMFSSLWTSISAVAVLETFVLADPAVDKIYWWPLILTGAVAFENLLFFQSIILLIHLFLSKLNYVFVNCLVYAVVVLSSTIMMHNKLLSALINSEFLLQGDGYRLLFQMILMLGVILICWHISIERFLRSERL